MSGAVRKLVPFFFLDGSLESLNDYPSFCSSTVPRPAWTLVREAYPVKKGDWVLVHAAAGGTGTLLCQMASHLGARVIGTASTAEKVDIAKRNGAEHVINYSHEDIEERVMALTNGQGVAGIFDGVGKDTFETDFKVIARKGTLVTFGNASGPVDPFSPMKLTPKNVKGASCRAGSKHGEGMLCNLLVTC